MLGVFGANLSFELRFQFVANLSLSPSLPPSPPLPPSLPPSLSPSLPLSLSLSLCMCLYFWLYQGKKMKGISLDDIKIHYHEPSFQLSDKQFIVVDKKGESRS